MTMRTVTAQIFEHHGNAMMQRKNRNATPMKSMRRFRALFGTSPENVATLWNRLIPYMSDSLIDSVQEVHLLWALLFLKLHVTTEVLAMIAGTNEKTFLKWQWVFVDMILDLQYEMVCDNIATTMLFCDSNPSILLVDLPMILKLL